MATVLDRIPLDRITAEARELDPVKVLLTLIAAPLFVLGWVIAKIAAVAWVAFSWSWTAVLVGWRTGREGHISGGSGG